MNNNVSSFQEDDWIGDLSEIQNDLDQTEIEEIKFLCRDYLQGEFILGSFKLRSFLLKKKKKFQKNCCTEFNHYICLMNWILCILCFEPHKISLRLLKVTWF